MSQIKKCIKVSLNGETKRLKLTTSFETLCLQTQDCFKLDMPIKFFYLDDDRELISVTSQADLDEALCL